MDSFFMNKESILDIGNKVVYNPNKRRKTTQKRDMNMIQEFSLENFRSIKTKQTISFLANPKLHTEFDGYLTTRINSTVTLLKACLLYGYNASGKSNLLSALDFLRSLIVSGPSTKEDQTGFVPFALDADTVKQPGIFTLIFFIAGIRYEYIVSLDAYRIRHESLRYTPERRITTLFTRIYDEEHSVSRLTIGQSCGLSAKDKTILQGNTIENCTTLFAYQKSNVHSPVLNQVVSYFKNACMPLINQKHSISTWSREQLKAYVERKQFFQAFLEKADFQITDFEIRDKALQVAETIPASFSDPSPSKGLLESAMHNRQIDFKQLVFTHVTDKGTSQIPSWDESEGTIRYFGLGGIVQQLIHSPHMVAIDELETSLHPDLVTFFLQMFLMNAQASQLLVTTHAQYLMEQDYIRNDMVWFCEKQADGGSEYYSAQDFKLHKNNNLANFYRAGKLGAKPVLGSPLLTSDGQ